MPMSNALRTLGVLAAVSAFAVAAGVVGAQAGADPEDPPPPPAAGPATVTVTVTKTLTPATVTYTPPAHTPSVLPAYPGLGG